jgi:cell division protein FtsX
MYPNSVYKAKKPNQQIPQNPSAQSFIIIVIMVMVFFLGVAAAARKQASKPKLFCGKT